MRVDPNTKGPSCVYCGCITIKAEDEVWKFWLCPSCKAGAERDD